jgi:hypothetical protein
MADQALTVQPAEDTSLSAEAMEAVLLGGDLKLLKADQRVRYYKTVCESIGLNPLTKPFEYIVLNGKVTLYAKKDCTDQLRARNGVSIQIVSREVLDDVYIVTARATMGNRQDEATGAVSLGKLTGESRANQLMKAETKAKRRVTLSICGLGWLDESEANSVPGAARVIVDDQGEIVGQDGGSREAQQEVAVAKIKMLKAASDEPTEEEPPAPPDEPPPTSTAPALGYDVLQGFAAIKKIIGSEAYYRILGANGFAKSTEITDRKQARTIYKEMAEEAKIIREKQEQEA